MEFMQDPKFWIAVAFLIFVAGAGKKVYGALAKMLDDRSAKIGAEIAEAARLRDEAEALLADYQRKQLEALQEAEAIVKHAREDAARARVEAEAAFEASLKRRAKAAEEKIAQAQAQAIAEVRAQVIDMAIAATQSLLKSKIDAGRQAQLVERAVGELAGKLN